MCICNKSLLYFLDRALKLSKYVHMHCCVMQLFRSQSTSVEKFRVPGNDKENFNATPSTPYLFLGEDYLVNLLTVVLKSLWKLQCYSIIGNSIMQQFWFNCTSVMMMSTTKSYIMETHLVNNRFLCILTVSFSPFQWSFWVVSIHLFLQTL